MLKFKNKIDLQLGEFIERKKWPLNNLYKVEYKFLKVILETGESSFSNYAIKLKDSLTDEEMKAFQNEILKNEGNSSYIPKEAILSYLKRKGINTKERREKFINQVTELGNLLIQTINGDTESYKLFHDKYQEYAFSKEQQEFFQKHIPNGILIYILDIYDELKDLNKKYPQIHSMPFSYYKYLITDIQYSIGVDLGLRKRKNALDILEDTKVMMSEISNENNIDSEDEGINEIEKLKFERDAYKSSLSFIQNNFNELKERIEEEALEAKKISVGEFFTTLNSERYGKFLDKVPYAEELLTRIRKEKLDKDVPSEIKSVMMFIKQVIKFIKDSGIEPIEEYNKVFHGTADEIANMNYIGEPFFQENEIKKLKVDAPGYRYNDIIISIPTVSEVAK